MRRISARQLRAVGQALLFEQLLGVLDHLIGEVDAQDLSVRADGLGDLGKAMPGAEADLQHAFAGLRSELFQSGLPHRLFGLFRQQVVDFRDLVVERLGLLFGLQ